MEGRTPDPTPTPQPSASRGPNRARPHLRATLRDLGPWYLVLTASAFSRKRRDRSYSITPCSTSPMLFCGQREGPGQCCCPRPEARPAAPPALTSSSAISGWSSPNTSRVR